MNNKELGRVLVMAKELEKNQVFEIPKDIELCEEVDKVVRYVLLLWIKEKEKRLLAEQRLQNAITQIKPCVSLCNN